MDTQTAVMTGHATVMSYSMSRELQCRLIELTVLMGLLGLVVLDDVDAELMRSESCMYFLMGLSVAVVSALIYEYGDNSN